MAIRNNPMAMTYLFIRNGNGNMYIRIHNTMRQ